jgi:hypothetical protein
VFPTSYLLDDRVGIGGPGERLWIVVGLGELSVDRGLELENTALESLSGELSEEPLDGVEPRSRGRGETEVESPVSFKPIADLRCLWVA